MKFRPSPNRTSLRNIPVLLDQYLFVAITSVSLTRSYSSRIAIWTLISSTFAGSLVHNTSQQPFRPFPPAFVFYVSFLSFSLGIFRTLLLLVFPIPRFIIFVQPYCIRFSPVPPQMVLFFPKKVFICKKVLLIMFSPCRTFLNRNYIERYRFLSGQPFSALLMLIIRMLSFLTFHMFLCCLRVLPRFKSIIAFTEISLLLVFLRLLPLLFSISTHFGTIFGTLGPRETKLCFLLPFWLMSFSLDVNFWAR